MLDDPIMARKIPEPADRSMHKPIYLVVVEDPRIPKEKVRYFRCSKINRAVTLEVVGYPITKAQIEKLLENPQSKEVDGKEVNIEFPYHRLVCIENITYKKVREENKKGE